MAPIANRKIIATKRALAIVTGSATLTTSGRMMVKRLGRCDLATLRHPRSYLMTFITPHLTMFTVIEVYAKRLRKLGRARVGSELMTYGTRRDVAIT
jgi:hypothetical protein